MTRNVSLSEVYRSPVIALGFHTCFDQRADVTSVPQSWNYSLSGLSREEQAQKSDHVIRQLTDELLWKPIQSSVLWDKKKKISKLLTKRRQDSELWDESSGSEAAAAELSKLPAWDQNTMDGAGYLQISSGESLQRTFPECNAENRLGIAHTLLCTFAL